MEDDPNLVRDLPDMVGDWDWYAINEIINTLRCNEGINVASKQRAYVEAWCKSMLQRIDMEHDIEPWSLCKMSPELYQVIIIKSSSAKATAGSDEQFFCNSLLDELRQTNAINLDVAWTIRQIRRYFQQHRGIMDN